MFNLEQAIADWRKQMLAAGIKTPVPLEELEIHLREEIERQTKSGLSGQEAFEISIQQIGEPLALKNEFKKSERTFMKTMTHIRSITYTMRILASVLMISGGSLFLPATWLDSFLVQNGLGQLPHTAVMRYALLGGGYLLVVLGVLVWGIARDVVRYRPLLITTIAIFLVGAPAFCLICAIAGMPRWCCITDFVICFVLGGIPLALCLWPASNRPVA